MKKTFLISGITILCIVVIALLLFEKEKAADTINIGAILPLTGDAALYGQNAKEGIDLALEQINSRGILGKKLKVIYEDSKADPQSGLSAFNKLITLNNVSAVIGDITSSVTLAIAPIAEKKEIVVLSPAATSPDITEAGDFIFRNWTSDAHEGKVISDFAYNQLEIRKLAVLYVNNDYGVGLLEVLKREFESKDGSQLIATESFDQNATDFRTQLAKIKYSQAEALYIISYPVEIINILRQISELELKTILLTTAAFQDKEILLKTGSTSEGVYFPFPKEPDTTVTNVTSFQKAFELKYGKKPGIVSDTGFDALNMIALAISREKGYSGRDIKNGLYSINDYPGASGIMSFDSNGDIMKPMLIKSVKNGEFTNF